MYHKENDKICKKIICKLREHGIRVNTESGQIYYEGYCVLKLECHALYLLRHGETYGVKENRFMSTTSLNSNLTDSCLEQLIKTAKQIEIMDFNYIFYSGIPRVKATCDIIRSQIREKVCFVEIPWMIGIDNAGWEGKSKEELTGEDKEDFYQREILHNIFAKSSQGSCWGEILCRCIDLVKYINENYKNKRILLISQGSIFIGLMIVLHMEKEIWENYDPITFFSLKSVDQYNYGKLQVIYEAGYNDLN